jgi:hypothetical protein
VGSPRSFGERGSPDHGPSAAIPATAPPLPSEETP